jgi:hypothetical protein
MQYLKSYQKKEIKFRIFSLIFFFLKNETEKKKKKYNKDMLMEMEMTSNPSM